MKIQTFSIVVGGRKCNANCHYCVSKMTGCMGELTEKVEEINERNFHKACRFAQMSGVSTVLLTSKGEPLLYHRHITRYLELLQKWDFPFIELQTNGILIPEMSEHLLQNWYDMGLTTISISCVHHSLDKNREIFGPEYKALPTLINKLHRIGFAVRLNCVMVKGYIDSLKEVKTFANMLLHAEQLTVRPVSNDIDIKDVEFSTENSPTRKIYDWVWKHGIEPKTMQEIRNFFNDPGHGSTKLLELAHGAAVYDWRGKNISINTCLTRSPDPDDIRQLIFFPDGHLYFDWVKKGAIII